ncbi:dihydrofolate reductase family protein [Amycolatopsis sp. NPDC049253]|jgi:dihydrofolate reductase|uniref:dihydrofolate reductase family protein n=1 Tax=Amycolatopsis sp. NPDC049253 TaxID=3155274 RepID=UPI00342F957B
MTTHSPRRLVLSTLVSLNGVISEPRAWAGPYFGPGSAAASLAELRGCSAMLMGRRTYDIFSRQWPDTPGDYAAHLNAMPKYVFSSTLRDPHWTNTTVLDTEIAGTVAAMKREPGGDLIVYGHGRFGRTLTAAGLVDELAVTVVPVIVPDGASFSDPGDAPSSWAVLSAGPGADPGLVSLRYRPRRG